MTDQEIKSNQMGLWACIAYVVGNVIGSGIFITPGGVLAQAGSIGLALIVWGVCGIISILGAIAYIELGTGIPTDGGDFAYATFVGWNAVAFSFMIVSALLTYPASTAVQSTTFGYYVVTGLEPFIAMEEGWKTALHYAIGIGLLLICTIINMHSLGRFGGYFQIVATSAKAIILAVVIIIGGLYYFGDSYDNATLADPMAGSDYSVGTMVMAAYGGLWSFAGWDILNYGAPAVKNPRRALPLSLIGGLIFVTVVYVATNGAFCIVLGQQAMQNSTAVAADFAQKSMGPFATVIPFATAVLLIGSVNANIFCTSRIMLEASKKGHLFGFLAAEHKKSGSPRAALIFQLVVSLIFTVFNVETLINYVSFVIYAQKCITMCALFLLRYRKMEVDPGVMRVPIIVSILFFVICTVLVAVPFYTEPVMTGIGVIVVACGLVVYYLFVKRRLRPSTYKAMSGAINDLLLKYLDAEVAPREDSRSPVKEVLPESGALLKDFKPNDEFSTKVHDNQEKS